MSDLNAHLEALAGQAHQEGGWGYTLGQPPQLEPTCLSLLALSLEGERYAEAIREAWTFIARCAAPDGSYRPNGGREEAIWHTSLVLFVQASLERPVSEVRRTAASLLGLRGKIPERLDDASEIHDIDVKIIGWPWAENNFSWVEPTAWACLGLRKAGHGSHDRVSEGQRLLLDRAHDEGGINYGNRRILGKFTEPMPGPTALMLLALQGCSEQRVATAVTYLLEQAQRINDLELLCWAKIALSVHSSQHGVATALRDIDKRIQESYAERAGTPWVKPAPMREALTALALGTETKNFFTITPAQAELSESRADYTQSVGRRRSLGDRVRSFFGKIAVQAVGALRPLPAQSQVHIAREVEYTTATWRGHFRGSTNRSMRKCLSPASASF
jgi:hypothetical protein